MKKHIIIIIITLFFGSSLLAQHNDTVKVQDKIILVDSSSTFVVDDNIKIDSSNYRNPKIAVYLSTFVPGAGQIYNGKYWKLPIVYGALGGGGYYFYTQNILYQTSLENLVILQNDSRIPDIDGYTADALKTMKDKYRRNRDLTGFILIVLWGFNIMDAFVDAHFSTFDISDDLSLHAKPYLMNSLISKPSIGLKLTINF